MKEGFKKTLLILTTGFLITSLINCTSTQNIRPTREISNSRLIEIIKKGEKDEDGIYNRNYPQFPLGNLTTKLGYADGTGHFSKGESIIYSLEIPPKHKKNFRGIRKLEFIFGYENITFATASINGSEIEDCILYGFLFEPKSDSNLKPKEKNLLQKIKEYIFEKN